MTLQDYAFGAVEEAEKRLTDIPGDYRDITREANALEAIAWAAVGACYALIKIAEELQPGVSE